jgi:hypothetical protein
MKSWLSFGLILVTLFVVVSPLATRADVFVEGWRHEKPFGWVYYAEPSWAYDIEVGWLHLESVFGRGTTGNGWNAAMGDFHAIMGSDWVRSDYFASDQRWSRWSEVESGIQQGIVPVADLEGIPAGDSFSVSGDLQVHGTTLSIPVSYAGGCAEHSFKLYVLNHTSGWTVYPPMVPMLLVHDAGGDDCEAAIFDTLEFDLGMFLPLWKSAEFVLVVNGETVSFLR